MSGEYVNKYSVRSMVCLVLSDYEKNGIELVEPSVIKEDLLNSIDAMSSIDLESVVRKIEKLVGGEK